MYSYIQVDAKPLHMQCLDALQIISKRIEENKPEYYTVSGMSLMRLPAQPTHYIHDDKKVIERIKLLTDYDLNGTVYLTGEDLLVLQRYKA